MTSSNKDKIAIAITNYNWSQDLENLCKILDIDTIFTYTIYSSSDRQVHFMNMILNWYGIIIACDQLAAQKCEKFKRRYIELTSECNTKEQIIERVNILRNDGLQ